MIDIDGSAGEGGGQMLRTALGLSVLTGRPFHMHSIRAARPKPGLAAQHLSCLTAVAEASSADVRGAGIGSREVEFLPGEDWKDEIAVDVGTAGSTTLVLQALMLASLGKRLQVIVTGGTDVRLAPTIGYAQHVIAPLLLTMGVVVEIRVLARGFFPEGGGKVEASISSTLPLRPATARITGGCFRMHAEAVSQNLPGHVCERMATSFRKALLSSGGADVRRLESRGTSTGASLTAWAESGQCVFGADALGERGRPAERVGEMVADRLNALLSSGADVDENAADHLLPYLAMASGPSSLTVRAVTPHLQTQADMVALFLPAKVRFAREGGLVRMSVDPSRT
jgi:RNA 3'-phosphate cyclase